MSSNCPAKKERGCFQCSRRRITCDKTEPSCLKCAKKGIECSGLSRIRFAEGVARRGRFKDFKVPKVGGEDAWKELPTATEFQSLRWANDRRSQKRRRVNVDDVAIELQPNTSSKAFSKLAVSESLAQSLPNPIEVDGGDVEEIDHEHDSLVAPHTHTADIARWISPINPKVRMLFSYFSEVIAPAMVVLDDNLNGYRSIVLPMALEDDLLHRAVSVVAAQHLCCQRPELEDVAEAGRAVIISRLRSDSLKQPANRVFNKFTWTTLIVLLVGETVTGSPDFAFFVQMLLCLSMNNSDRDPDSALTAFLQAQTHMFKLLGVPLLGEEVGVLTMMKASESLMGFLSYSHLPEDCEDRRTADLIRQCFVSACDIYTRCAASADVNLDFGISHDAIQEQSIVQLIGVLSQISTNSRGAHALVWVYFVAGAASTNQAHRAFFVKRMEQVYGLTQFRNIPNAIQSLKNIWARGDRTRWTLCLPQISNVLVM